MSGPEAPQSRGLANTSLALTILGFMGTFGSGEPVPGLLCGGLGFCTGVASLVLGVFGPARFPVTAAGILGSLGSILLWLAVWPALEIRP